MPLPVVVGVAWGRLTSSFHEDAEKRAAVGLVRRQRLVILCNKSPVTPTRVAGPLHNTYNKMPLPVGVGVALGPLDIFVPQRCRIVGTRRIRKQARVCYFM